MSHEELKKYFEHYRNRLGKTFFFFHYYVELNKIIINNKEVLKCYNSFFPIVQESLFKSSVIEIAKFFDTDHRTFSFNHLLCTLESNLNQVNSIEFICLSNNLISKNSKEGSYKDITQQEIDSWRTKRNALLQIKQIKTCRDQYEAHDDRNKDNFEFSHEQIIELKEFLGHITNRIPVVGIMHWKIEHDAQQDLESLIQKLR